MVGAIADWFAVTALFRSRWACRSRTQRSSRPARTRWPAASRSSSRRTSSPSRWCGSGRDSRGRPPDRWLAGRREPARGSSTRRRRCCAGCWHASDDEDVTALVTDELLPRLAEEPLSEVTGRLLQEIVAAKAHHGLVDLAVLEAHRWLVENPETWCASSVSARRCGPRSGSTTGSATARAPRGRGMGHRTCGVNPNHSVRLALDDLLADLAEDLQNDPDTIEQAERLKRRMLDTRRRSRPRSPRFGRGAPALVARSRIRVSRCGGRFPRLAEFGQRLLDDADAARPARRVAADSLPTSSRRTAREMTTVITETIERWDGRGGGPQASSCTSAATCSSSASTAPSSVDWPGW